MSADAGLSDSGAYCRQIEAYLCRQNGGHLVRIVGPAFEKVSEWARRGVPLKVVYRGIDRYVQRQLGRSTRRRPARIEFCEADVLDVFDEWKRAVGTLAGFSEARPQSEEAGESADSARVRGPSLPSHLARVQVRVSSVLAGQRVPPRLTSLLEDLVSRLDEWRLQARSARGDDRRQLLELLRTADADLLDRAWAVEDEAGRSQLRAEAADELATFRDRMTDEAWRTSIDAAARRLLRLRLGLPTLSLD